MWTRVRLKHITYPHAHVECCGTEVNTCRLILLQCCMNAAIVVWVECCVYRILWGSQRPCCADGGSVTELVAMLCRLVGQSLNWLPCCADGGSVTELVAMLCRLVGQSLNWLPCCADGGSVTELIAMLCRWWVSH